MRKLIVKGRYLAFDDGEPFFYLGDTAWELFHVLDKDEAKHYFTERSRQGFNVAQAVALAEQGGLTVENAYGRLPLHFTEGMPDPTRPDTDGEYSYWDHVDYIIDLAKEYGMFITLLPTWGDKFNKCWGRGPEIFDEENAYIYGKWIANRYKDRENIIWMLGGDRQLEPKHRRIIDEMARGIKEVDQNHLMTFHPSGCSDSTVFVGDADYIDFHTSQTGHSEDQCYQTDSIMLKMAAFSEKPYMDSEPRYEDNPARFDVGIGYPWTADDVRQNVYWNMLTGVCGHTYGNHSVWDMNKEPCEYWPFTWDEALTHTGAEQMKYAKQLRLSHDFFSLRHAPELVDMRYFGMGHIQAARGDDYAYIYSPLGLPFDVDLEQFGESIFFKAYWFDPRTGDSKIFAVLPCYGKTTLAPPSQGMGNDWVLILEAVKK